MIYTEDADFVNFTLTDGEIAVPFSVTKPQDGPCSITVYAPFLGIAEEFERLYTEDPFTDSAVAFLKEHLTEPMHRYGFKLSRDIDNRIRTFLIRDVGEVHSDICLANTRIVSGADDLEALVNLTTHAIEMDADDPDDISAIAVENGKIIAYATLNDVFEGEDFLEISVECALGYRGQGYASSCAAALAKELATRGYTVSYKCRHTNAASARVAMKAGFKETSMEYNFVCYREKERGEE